MPSVAALLVVAGACAILIASALMWASRELTPTGESRDRLILLVLDKMLLGAIVTIGAAFLTAHLSRSQKDREYVYSSANIQVGKLQGAWKQIDIVLTSYSSLIARLARTDNVIEDDDRRLATLQDDLRDACSSAKSFLDASGARALSTFEVQLTELMGTISTALVEPDAYDQPERNRILNHGPTDFLAVHGRLAKQFEIAIADKARDLLGDVS